MAARRQLLADLGHQHVVAVSPRIRKAIDAARLYASNRQHKHAEKNKHWVVENSSLALTSLNCGWLPMPPKTKKKGKKSKGAVKEAKPLPKDAVLTGIMQFEYVSVKLPCSSF